MSNFTQEESGIGILKKQEFHGNKQRNIAQRFGCSLPPPYNPWFLDLPYEWLPTFYNEISSAKIEEMVQLTRFGDGGLFNQNRAKDSYDSLMRSKIGTLPR